MLRASSRPTSTIPTMERRIKKPTLAQIKMMLRVTYFVPVSLLVTLLVWMYRYIWFSIETVPEDRVLTAVLGLCFCAFFFFIEAIDTR